MRPIRLVLLLAAIMGSWSDVPWYALQNLSRNRAVVADAFRIDVHWLPGSR